MQDDLVVSLATLFTYGPANAADPSLVDVAAAESTLLAVLDGG